ncbi:MAG: 50S ribosomal protein P1 [Nanohaloarchaea archaeon SW_10_44_10]|nr:MAG: 50S ribosomal protein P1 [Nanohaloarchaea archaeon SW_10_44_10]
MELVYAALTLHEAGKEVDEENLQSIVEAADLDVEDSEVKALVAALEDVDIEEAMETAVAGGGAPAPSSGSSEDSGEEAEEEEAEEEGDEDEADEDEAAEGLGDLF